MRDDDRDPAPAHRAPFLDLRSSRTDDDDVYDWLGYEAADPALARVVGAAGADADDSGR